MSALFVIGGILYLVGWMMTVAAAFRQHALWGVAVLFVPFAAVVFVIMNWSDARRGFYFMAGGIGMFVLVGVLAPLTGEKGPVPKQAPVAKDQPVARAAPASAATYTPPPPSYTPPEPVAPVETPAERPMIKQVYADNATHTYYSADCKRRPPNAYRIARSVAVQQGFKEAPCL